MRAGIEIGELVDAVEDVPDEFFEEQPRGDANLAPQRARNGGGEIADIRLVTSGGDPVERFRLRRVNIPHLHAHLDEPVEIESRQFDLRSTRVVESGIGLEVGV